MWQETRVGGFIFDLFFWEYSPSWSGKLAQVLVSPPFEVQLLS